MTDEPSAEPSGTTLLNAMDLDGIGTAMVVIHDTIRLGQLEMALDLVRAAKSRFGADPGLLLTETMVLCRLGDRAAARDCLARAQSIASYSAVTEMYEAMLDLDAGQTADARVRLRRIIDRCPDYPGVAGMLASIVMPGPNYREVLRALHQVLRPRAYLEIGVETGATLALAQAERIVGVDPVLRPLRREKLASHAVVHELTSEGFFAQFQPRDVFGDVPLDLAFVDGLHRFTAAIADFSAIERWAHPGTVIVMHDALPIAPIYASVERSTRFWVGDVWKATALLLRHRPDLRIRIIPTPPSGLVVVRLFQARIPKDPGWHRALATECDADQLCNQDPCWPAEFPLVDNDLNGYRQALGSASAP